MGRVKLQIKRIENTTNRQVTFSKRRNGLVKKAYELSVLCDVDIALIMFSPSGRLSLFSGNKNIEEVLARYINLPEHERGRVHNQEFLQRALGKLMVESDRIFPATSPTIGNDYQLEECQREILKCKSQLQEMEKRLRIYECDLTEITTLSKAKYHEQILEGTLKQIRLHKQLLEETYASPPVVPPTPQAHLPLDLVSEHSNDAILDWLPQPQRDPQVHILNFLDSNGLLPMRDEASVEMLPQHLNLQNLACDNDNVSRRNCLQENNNALQRPAFGQANINVNLSPWIQFYPTGNNNGHISSPSGRALLDLYLSQITPSTSTMLSSSQP
ncbi:hypothetical protein ACFE04_004633 [Oxalis oulophora]